MEADLVSSLMSRGSLHHLVVSILVHLDPASLASVASCCRLWAAFVRQHVTSLSGTGPCTRKAATTALGGNKCCLNPKLECLSTKCVVNHKNKCV